MENIKLNGMIVTIGKETLTVDTLPLKNYECEIKLKTGTPDWQGPIYTPGTSWRFKSMTPESLNIYDGKKQLKEGIDYLVDYDWGTIGTIKENTTWSKRKVKLEYSCTSSRLDLVVRDHDGKLKLIKGKLNSRKPLLPECPENSTALFSIYLPHNTLKLSKKNINIIDSEVKAYGPAKNTQYLDVKMKKLKSGHPFTLVFFGDSITAQTDPVGGNFVSRFRDWITKKYSGRKVNYLRMKKNGKNIVTMPPKNKEITIVMAGVGGDSSAKGLKRLDRHVLAHKPDIVVVMFGVNDENKTGKNNEVSTAQYAENLTTIIKKIREVAGEPLLMTTSMKNLNWEATFGNLNKYAETARIVTQKNKVCLIDNFKAWENLPKQGYNYMIPLGSCINHPNDMGHIIFSEGLKAVFDDYA